MSKETFEIDWCLGSWVKDTDFLLSEWFDDNLPTLYQQDNIIYEYNQFAQTRSKKSCTLFSAMGAISDLFNYEVPLSEAKEVDDRSYTHWRVKWSWWWVNMWVKEWADYWNEVHSDLWKVAYYRIDLTNTKLVNDILDKWYTIMTNYRGNSKYSLDYLKDAVLNGTDFWAATYWHAVNIIKKDWKICVKDSEKWRKTNNWKKDCNIYELEHLIKDIKPFSVNWYIYTKVSEDNYDRIKELNEFKSLLINTIENNSAMWHKTKDVSYQRKLNEMNNSNRQKLIDINEQLKLLV